MVVEGLSDFQLNYNQFEILCIYLIQLSGLEGQQASRATAEELEIYLKSSG